MKELVVNGIYNSTELVDRFEGYNQTENQKYDRLVILDMVKGPYSFINGLWFGYIIERADSAVETRLTMSKLQRNYGFFNSTITKYYDKRNEYYKSGIKDILLSEEEFIYFRAQGSHDRYGFHKRYDYYGNLIENKEYGHTSHYYRIIGFRISKPQY